LSPFDGWGDQVRTVPLPPIAVRISTWLDIRGRHPGPLWTGQRGQLTISGIVQVILSIGQAAGLPGLRPHRLRHTYAKAAPTSPRSKLFSVTPPLTPRPDISAQAPPSKPPSSTASSHRAATRIGPPDGGRSAGVSPLPPLTDWLLLRGRRGAAELLAIAEELRRADIQLELLTGPLQGLYDPSGHGAALFAFFAGMAESEREYIREKSLEGQASARERGRHGGRPKVFDDDMIAYARSLRGRGVPVPEIARKLVIRTGKNKGRNPSLASVYRVLGEDGEG
jgi:hypothetical protein